MKYTLALIAAAAARHSDVWGLRSVNDHSTDSGVQIAFGNGATAAANDDAKAKSETVAWEGGSSRDAALPAYSYLQMAPEYAFVMTTEGGIFVQEGHKDDTHPVWGLRSVNWHDGDSDRIQGFGDAQTAGANADAQAKAEGQDYAPATWGFSQTADDLNLLQLRGDCAAVKWYTVFDHDADETGHGYIRAPPARFAADTDDIFMRSMVANYAVELGDCVCDDEGAFVECKPSGSFWLNHSGAYAAAEEVLATHKGLEGEALGKYLDSYFEKAWGHFDVNLTGTIEVSKAPQLMRFLLSDQRASLGESGQTHEIGAVDVVY
jgi:hypothetical protein